MACYKKLPPTKGTKKKHDSHPYSCVVKQNPKAPFWTMQGLSSTICLQIQGPLISKFLLHTCQGASLQI